MTTFITLEWKVSHFIQWRRPRCLLRMGVDVGVGGCAGTFRCIYWCIWVYAYPIDIDT